MKIKEIRMATPADKKLNLSTCSDSSPDGLDKPPC